MIKQTSCYACRNSGITFCCSKHKNMMVRKMVNIQDCSPLELQQVEEAEEVEEVEVEAEVVLK